jgi:ribulose kinase
MGTDITGISPILVAKNSKPFAFSQAFKSNHNVFVWLWEDHVSAAKSVACA